MKNSLQFRNELFEFIGKYKKFISETDEKYQNGKATDEDKRIHKLQASESIHVLNALMVDIRNNIEL